MDAFPHAVVGWSIESSQIGLLVTNAHGMVLEPQAPRE
jgi:hypothetical protein